tara:strand:- start:1134 stop:1379 length:246 start_codon:yes stop_codon:yes gene_type:complete
MILLFVIFAFVLAWFFIEITLFIVNKNYKVVINSNKIPYKQFVKNLRILAILLIFGTILYMYFFQNSKFLQAIEYCLGIVK